MIAPEESEGLLRELFDAAVERAGKVFKVINIQSLRPRVLRATTEAYLEVMHSDESGLSRAQREMIATVVSQVNGCHY